MLKKLYFRIDAEAFRKEYQQRLSILQGQSKHLSDYLTDGCYGILPKSEDYLDDGLPLLRGVDVRNISLNIDSLVKVPFDYYSERFAIKKGDIFILVKGATIDYPDGVLLITQDVGKVIFNGSCFRIRLHNINTYYVYVFMQTKYFTFQKTLAVANNGIEYNSLESIKNYYIPEPSVFFQLQIEQMVKTAHMKLEESKRLYTEAEKILLEELGLKNWQPKNQNINIKTLKESFLSSGRLDAEYYQSKYDEIETKIKKYHGGFQSLINYVSDYSTGQPFDSNLFTDCGCNVIRINNIKNGELDLSNAVCVPTESIDVDMKDLVKKNDILISMSGTIGNCCVIRENIFAAINQRILKIVPKNYDSNVLCLVIDSIIGKTQFDRIGTGGVQTNISSKDMFHILIPKLPISIQTEISAKIQQSFALKAESKGLLEEAKLMVEQEIEKVGK